MSLPKILVVDDNTRVQKEITDALEGIAEVIPAFSIWQAYRFFLRHKDLYIIIVATCMKSYRPNTQKLIAKMRETFDGIIISMSILSLHRLIPKTSAYCDYKCSKTKVAEITRGLLTLRSIAKDTANTK